MQFFENIRLAFTSIIANKMRALLTMLGIIIGISAVITITTIGSSIQKTLTNTLNSLGATNYFQIYTYKDYSSGNVAVSYSNDGLTRDMLNKLIEEYPDYYTLSLEKSYGASTMRNYKNQDMTIFITALDNFDSRKDMKVIKGREINREDSKQKKHCIMVSDWFVEHYFESGAEVLGETLTIEIPETEQAEEFVIVGIYALPDYFIPQMTTYYPEYKGAAMPTFVFVPIDTMAYIMRLEDETYSYTDIYYNPDYDIDMQEQTLSEFFEKEFKEAGVTDINVEVYNMNKELGTINTVVNVVTIAISVIAAISLIVGGVGVMNIMLVSITERTKEIGIRKALGAQNKDIRLQFVIEAILICLIGGIIGIIIGIVNGILIGSLAKTVIANIYPAEVSIFQITVQPSFVAIMISVIFSIMTGVFFGYYPANKAAKMDPIDALRYD